MALPRAVSPDPQYFANLVPPHLIEEPPKVVAALRDTTLNLLPRSEPLWVLGRDTSEIVRLLDEHDRCVVVLDGEHPRLDVRTICSVAHRLRRARVLVFIPAPVHAPAMLKAGSDALLLQPFARNLLAARVGRLARALNGSRGADDEGYGTNRACLHVSCPGCGAEGAVGFDFSSYRRAWYACLMCDRVWLGKRLDK